MSKIFRNDCRHVGRLTIEYVHARHNADAINQPRKATTMGNATAKRIEAGVYDYRGFRIVRECYGWAILEPVNRSYGIDYEAADAMNTLADAKRLIDRWKNN